MKKKIIVLGACSLLLCGCGKIPTLSNGDEAVVSFKDGKMISANDFYNEIKDSYGLQTLVNMIDKYIYENEFKDKMSDASAYAEATIKQMRANYSSDAELLQIIQYYYRYQTIEAYQNSVYISYLQNEGIKEYIKSKITDKELEEYYKNDVYPSMTISHILITPEVTNDMTSEQKTEAENKAKETVNTIIGELKKAKSEDLKDKFSELAKEYSKDSSTKDKGGDLGEINIDSLNGSYDELVKKAASLKDNEFSSEIITTELGYHVILKTATGEKKSYDESLDSMKDKITTKKLNSEDGNSLSVEALKHYRDKYDLDIVDSEIDREYGRYMNNLINSANQKSSNN